MRATNSSVRWRGLGLSTFIAQVVALWQHPLMQYAGDDDALFLLPIENHVAALLHAPQSRAYLVARSSGQRIFRKPFAARFKLVEIPDGLPDTPLLQSVCTDGNKIGLGPA